MSISTNGSSCCLQVSSPHCSVHPLLNLPSLPNSLKPFHWVIRNSQLIISKIPKIPAASLVFLFSPLSNWNLTALWGNRSPWTLLKYKHVLFHRPPNTRHNSRLKEMKTNCNAWSQIGFWARKNIPWIRQQYCNKINFFYFNNDLLILSDIYHIIILWW